MHTHSFLKIDKMSSSHKMRLTNYMLLFLLIAIFNSLALSAMVEAHVLSKNRTEVFPTLLFLGDSILDTGNNNEIITVAKANFPPYGRDFPGKKATGRFSNGKIIPDIIASYIGLEEYVPPYLGTNLTAHDLVTGVTFASAGTGYEPLTALTQSSISMTTQLEMFNEYMKKLAAAVGQSKASSVLSKATYVICAGSNDVVQYFRSSFAGQLNLTQYSDNLKVMATQYVKDLYKLGARNFAVVGLPPVGCIPAQRTVGGGSNRTCAPDRNKFALMYNSKLKAEINRLKKTDELQGSKFSVVDIYPILMELMQHPEKYGFKESRKGCCGTGLIEVAVFCNSLSKTCANASEYVFWDSYHPTQRAYEIIVSDIIEQTLADLA